MFHGAQDHATVSAGPYTQESLGYFQVSLAAASGHQTLAQLAAAASVPLANIATLLAPTGPARVALIYVETAAVRWLDDGQNASASYGFPLAAGQDVSMSGDLGALNFACQSGTAVLNIGLYK